MMKCHAVCNLFPEMDAVEFAALKQSIAERGCREPVIVLNGQIIDGRHRWRACEELGLPCPTVEYDADEHGESLVDFVVDLNLNRRQLTASQRAAVAAEALPLYEAEAKERQKASGGPKTAIGASQSGPGKIAGTGRGDARDHAAKATGASPRYVSEAKAIKQAAPEVFEKVKAGEVSVAQAVRQIRDPEKPKSKAPPRPPAKDCHGHPVPDIAAGALASAPQFKELVNKVHALKREVAAMGATAVGRHLRTQQIETHFKAIVAAIEFAVPYCVCPYMPNCTDSSCRTCGGAAWVTREIYDRLPSGVRR